MIEKNAQVVIGKTRCCACSNASTKLANGHPSCDECADAITKNLGEKKAADAPQGVMFPR